MADMLSNPNVAQAMNEALNNPQLVDVMIQSNPMLRDNPNAREIIQSPFFRNMLTNPDMLRTVAQMRRSMGGGAGGEAFPAPGATDTTPADAAGAGAGGGAGGPNNAQASQFPFMTPGMFGGPGAGAAGGFGGAGSQGANPFAALFNPLGATAPAAPQTGAGAGGAPVATSTTQTSSGDNSAQRDAPGGDTGSAQPRQPGSDSQPPNPFAGLFGGPQGGAANPFGMTPEMMQNFAQMMRGAPQGGAANPFGMTPEMMQNVMQNLMGGGAEPAAPADTRPPEERYAEQLSQLNEMGFYDFDQNVAALRRSGGNVQGAVNFLLGG